MRNINFGKILPLIAFAALAFFSCNWTANSFYVWQPDLTLPGAWFLAVALYVIASICFTMIWKALDKNVSFRGKIMSRGTTLCVSVVGFLVFWMFSLLTNTHYLIYKSEIKKVATDELNSAKYYLHDITEGGCERCKQQKQVAYNDLVNTIENTKQRLISEMKSIGNEGPGRIFNSIIDSAQSALRIGFTKLSATESNEFIIIHKMDHAKSRDQWDLILRHYIDPKNGQLSQLQTQFLIILHSELNKCDLLNNPSYNDLIADIDVRLSDMSSKTVGYKIMEIVNNDLVQSYSAIAEHANVLSFKDKDKDKYTETNAQPKTVLLAQVPTVWEDYLQGKYAGHGFLWRIMLSILVDLAAFIFFNIAFNNKNNH